MNWLVLTAFFYVVAFMSGSLAAAPVQNSEAGNAGINSVQTRIAQGVSVPEFSTPWMVNLRTQAGRPFCGGVVIDERHVLTAAHCIVRFSAAQIVATAVGIEYGVERYWVPEQYRWSQLNADIAVLRLSRPIVNVQPLAFVESIDTATLQAGDQLEILGFGQTVTNGSFSPTLLRGAVPYVPAAVCAQAWRSDFPSLAELITSHAVCAGGSGGLIDTCTGDSGGPLLVQRGGIDPQWRLLGVTSFGEATCGGALKPSVYTSVIAFEDAILKAVSSEAYSANWTQGLVEFGGSELRRIAIENTSDVDWNLGALARESSVFRLSQSTCADRVLQPGQVCELVFEFHPPTGGFFSERLEFVRAGAEPLWLDLQGLGYETVQNNHFANQPIIAFAGGESDPDVLDAGGISGDGYIAWRNVDPLTTFDVFVGVEQTGDVRLFIDFVPLQSDQAPLVEMRLLDQYEQEIPFELDQSEGWQSLTVNVNEQDFLLVRIRAKGLGFNGEFRLDLAKNGDESSLQFDAQNQDGSTSALPAAVSLEAGGVFDFWLSMVLLGCLITRLGFAVEFFRSNYETDN